MAKKKNDEQVCLIKESDLVKMQAYIITCNGLMRQLADNLGVWKVDTTAFKQQLNVGQSLLKRLETRNGRTRLRLNQTAPGSAA